MWQTMIPSGETVYPTYWRYWLGQDAMYMIKEGYFDWVSPMIYSDGVSYLNSTIQYWQDLAFGGEEGIVPLVPFLDNCVDADSTVANFWARVNITRERNCDGWITFRYGGLGDGEGSAAPDMADYYDVIQMNGTFTVENISISENVVSWDTTSNTNAAVEYSTEPIFNATKVFDARVNFHYWDVNYYEGTWTTNATADVHHEITLTGLTTGTLYYCRIRSGNADDNVTSQIFTFIYNVTAGGENWWQMTFNHLDRDSNVVDAEITWKLYNASELLDYTEGEYTLLDGTYTLKTYYLTILINQKNLATATYGNTTINVNLQMKAISSGYIAFNTTITKLVIYADSPQSLVIDATCVGATFVITDVTRNCTHIMKGESNMTDWTYSSSPSNHITFTITSFDILAFWIDKPPIKVNGVEVIVKVNGVS